MYSISLLFYYSTIEQVLDQSHSHCHWLSRFAAYSSQVLSLAPCIIGVGTPWERALEREPSRERMSTYRRSDTGGEGPTRDRPTQRAPTQRAPDTQRERPTQGARPTQETHRQEQCNQSINQHPQRPTHEHKRSHILAPPHGQQTHRRHNTTQQSHSHSQRWQLSVIAVIV